MITNKDVRVENGNIVINGDKYPLDGQSPEAIMKIVEDNSDTAPTENSKLPVRSDGIKTYVDTQLSTALDNSKIEIIDYSLTNLDLTTTWGALYMSDVLEINYSSLGLTNPPKNVLISVSSNSTILVGLSAITAAKAEYRLMRAASTTGLSVKVSAIIVY